MIGGSIRTPDQRLRVFVSSTLAELAAERAAVREAIERLQLTPVLFELGARPHPPRDLYRAYLEQSQIFVGIYWQRYGWVAPEETVSGLEDEYQPLGRDAAAALCQGAGAGTRGTTDGAAGTDPVRRHRVLQAVLRHRRSWPAWSVPIWRCCSASAS